MLTNRQRLHADVAMIILFVPAMWARFKERAAVSPSTSWRRVFFSDDSLAVRLRDAALVAKDFRDHLQEKDRERQESQQRRFERLGHIHASQRLLAGD